MKDEKGIAYDKPSPGSGTGTNRPYSSAVKMLSFVGFFAYYVGGYGFMNHISAIRAVSYSVALPFESKIPFLPDFAWFYYFVEPIVIILVLAVDDMEILWRTLKAFFCMVTVAFVIFCFFPVQMVERPVIVPDGSASMSLLHFTFWMDKPYNLFPSLHVATSFLSSLIVYYMFRRLGILTFLAAILVSISVIFVKQHYIADVVAGAVMAVITFRLFFKSWHR